MSKLTLYFKRPKHWGSSIRLHYWGTQPAVAATKWPGVPMRDVGSDWYGYEIEGAASASVIFTDGEGQQTADLFRDQDGWFTLPGEWSAKNPDAKTADAKTADAKTADAKTADADVPPDAKGRSRKGYYTTA